jgi:hypothetical protein
MNARSILLAMVVTTGVAAPATAVGVATTASTAVAATPACTRRPTATKTGAAPWEVRQASGLTTVAASPGVLFTHNDRGLRDSPAPGEDTTNAAVWAMSPTGTLRARFRLVDESGLPIPYFDTEAISTDRQGRIILADTGTNLDQRTTVALYRFTPPVVSPTQAYDADDVTAQVIPVQYFNAATGGQPVLLNVETFTVDPSGNAWFIPRSSNMPYSYVASAAALDTAAATGTPVRAVRSSHLKIAGPVTDASVAPGGKILLVKTMKQIFRYDLTGTTVAAALATTPCLLATATTQKTAGFGEAIVVDDAGGFYTVAESSKTLHSGTGNPIWSFRP